ncbi:protein SENESCENCE-ASSOCIATED GENE 21, mitochondrial-like [Miscanthus floridulus]|uniref:protein SENESCENCE-ASSOCIATED GENE 21, mitochondrial-like n=1 Tax=Miscanthus floridulus TaxID=154761 RepID=UPI00345A3C5E
MERVASSCVSLLAQRRAYSVAAAMAKGAARRADEKKAAAVTKRVMGKKEVNTAAAAAEEKKAWVPDPVTGYYRPGSAAKEVDAAELRAKLLSEAAAN